MALTKQGSQKFDERSMQEEMAEAMHHPVLVLDLPVHSLHKHGIGNENAYELITSELLLDGQARLNLATFVTTWMPSTAARLMADTADKNMIDKDEYPQTAELEARCVRILAQLLVDHTHRLDEFAPVHRPQEAQAADAVAHRHLVFGLLPDLRLHQVFDGPTGFGEPLFDPGERQCQGGALPLQPARQLRNE